MSGSQSEGVCVLDASHGGHQQLSCDACVVASTIVQSSNKASLQTLGASLTDHLEHVVRYGLVLTI